MITQDISKIQTPISRRRFFINVSDTLWCVHPENYCSRDWRWNFEMDFTQLGSPGPFEVSTKSFLTPDGYDKMFRIERMLEEKKRDRRSKRGRKRGGGGDKDSVENEKEEKEA